MILICEWHKQPIGARNDVFRQEWDDYDLMLIFMDHAACIIGPAFGAGHAVEAKDRQL